MVEYISIQCDSFVVGIHLSLWLPGIIFSNDDGNKKWIFSM